MRIPRFLKRPTQKKEAKPASKELDATIREIQKKLMDASRENGKPRIGA